jgi:hypothetical protein
MRGMGNMLGNDEEEEGRIKLGQDEEGRIWVKRRGSSGKNGGGGGGDGEGS